MTLALTLSRRGRLAQTRTRTPEGSEMQCVTTKFPSFLCVGGSFGLGESEEPEAARTELTHTHETDKP